MRDWLEVIVCRLRLSRLLPRKPTLAVPCMTRQRWVPLSLCATAISEFSDLILRLLVFTSNAGELGGTSTRALPDLSLIALYESSWASNGASKVIETPVKVCTVAKPYFREKTWSVRRLPFSKFVSEDARTMARRGAADGAGF